MQVFEKCDERYCLRRVQIFSVSRHVAASLDHLSDKLTCRQPHGDAVQRRTSLPANFPKRMAVAALLDLKHERTLPLKRARPVQIISRHWITAPSVHVRAPGSEPREVRQGPERYGDQHHRQNRDGPPTPTLFSFAGKERQK